MNNQISRRDVFRGLLTVGTLGVAPLLARASGPDNRLSHSITAWPTPKKRTQWLPSSAIARSINEGRLKAVACGLLQPCDMLNSQHNMKAVIVEMCGRTANDPETNLWIRHWEDGNGIAIQAENTGVAHEGPLSQEALDKVLLWKFSDKIKAGVQPSFKDMTIVSVSHDLKTVTTSDGLTYFLTSLHTVRMATHCQVEKFWEARYVCAGIFVGHGGAIRSELAFSSR